MIANRGLSSIEEVRKLPWSCFFMTSVKFPSPLNLSKAIKMGSKALLLPDNLEEFYFLDVEKGKYFKVKEQMIDI